MMESQSTVILGGGFTGLFTALHLSHSHYPSPIVLVDQEWSFIFKPLLYEFLSGEMNVELVWQRYDHLLQNSGVAFVRDRVETIDLEQREVHLASGLRYSYRYLVLALGGVNTYFGIAGADTYALPFRTATDAIALGEHLRDKLQRASQMEDVAQRQQLLTVAIMGAGRAGVELAATLADLLPIWYAPLGGDVSEIRIVVVQRGKEILKGDADRLRQTVETALQQRSAVVQLHLEAQVTTVEEHKVILQRAGQTEELVAATIVWTTGTATHPLIKALPIPDAHRDHQGRLHVTPTLQLPDFPEVFAGGDCTVYPEQPLPATAQVAYQQGAAIAHNLKALADDRPLNAAQVRLRGTLLKLGLDESTAEIFDRFEVKGKLGHLIRQATYVDLLPTPIQNFKATTEWLTDEVFHQIAKV